MWAGGGGGFFLKDTITGGGVVGGGPGSNTVASAEDLRRHGVKVVSGAWIWTLGYGRIAGYLVSRVL